MAELDPRIRDWAASELGRRIKNIIPIGAGASRQIWRVETPRRAVVLRVDTGDGPVAGTVLDLAREATVYRALAGSGLPVPALIAVEPSGAALLMELVDGIEGLAAVDDTEVRDRISDDYLRWLGRLHRLEVASLRVSGLGMPTTAAEHATVDLDMWTGIATERTKGWQTPAVAVAAQWLRSNVPPVTTATSLCHGDAGVGNFLFAGDKVTALLDWEFAHVGDPQDDLAWVAVRNHLLGRPMNLGRAFAAWSATTGWLVNPAVVDYYRVFVLMRMAISCDASLAWRDGVEDDAIRTQVLLRPWLGVAIGAALGFAGCADAGAVAAEAEARLASSPHAALLALIPPLERLELR